MNPNWGGTDGDVLVNRDSLSRKHVIEGLRMSLQRLNLDYADVVYVHRQDRLMPIKETLRISNHVIEQKCSAL